MAFEGLASRLADTFKKLRGRGKLSEKDISEGLREVRLALLEADVNFKVVKEFIGNVRARCLDAEVMESLTPAQQVVKSSTRKLSASWAARLTPGYFGASACSHRFVRIAGLG